MKRKKRALSFLLAAVILGISACTAAPPVSGGGGYSGSVRTEAQGNNGMVTVNTTFKDGRITKVEVLSHGETPGISDPAIERIPQNIAAGNTINVDTVAGATNTSRAILSAVRDAITQAGLDPNQFMAKASAGTGRNVELNTDILVIGAGGAGLSAANIIIREGKRVIVLEKMSSVGGATAVSGGGFIGGASRLQGERGVSGDSFESIFNNILKGGEDNYQPLLRLFAQNIGKTIDWMYYDLRLPIEDGPPNPFVEYDFARVFYMKGGPSEITNSLYRVFREAGGEVLFETRVMELIVRNNRVCGAVAEGPGGSRVTVNAEKVILATGGYGNNKELLPPSVSDILYYGPVCATGDGLLMAQDAGAMSWYMDHVKVYPQGIEVSPGIGRVATGASMVTTNTTSAIYVNARGDRVINENEDFVSIKLKTMEQPERMIYILMDQAAFTAWRNAGPPLLSHTDIDRFVAQNGGVPMFANAPTIEGAARIAGIDPARLQATVDRFNGFVRAGQDADFGRTQLFPIGQGPYYLIEHKLRFASTLGGLKINDNMQVLTAADRPIEGLYAAGEIVGGVHGKESMPACNVGWALTSGRLAGLSVVK
ncbi:MAG: FAD-dependent oxidoreductase [Spirochaetaceae bacterium]|jgi:fumarate reductase flavoprotein subunit|nr:FAD-dependent oxidoreductase [Spirochaetaceae bacterium]